MRSCIVTSHLYGLGGGAKAVFACARGLMAMSDTVVIFTRTAIPDEVLAEAPPGLMYAKWYPGCAAGYDILLNVDHFRYAEPLAGLNAAHIFHPHSGNEPPTGYTSLLANSAYTAREISRLWDSTAEVIYIPIEDDYVVGAKERLILHVSRFSAPTQYADKGHRAMIDAFKMMNLQGWTLVMAGAMDPSQSGYLSSLMDQARRANIRFAPSLPRSSLVDLYSRAAVYWHMTGITMPGIPGAQEHLGLTTIEAMASGCVPVVRSTGGQREIVEDGFTGLYADTPEEMAAKTTSIIGDLHLWSVLQQNALIAGRAWMDESQFIDGFRSALLDGHSMAVPVGQFPRRKYALADVDIIIPVWNSSTIHKCLDVLPPGPNVIVVDNGSDMPVSHDRIDRYIRLEENIGFAAANMVGYEASTRPVILALNDDCIAPGDSMWLEMMLLTLSEPDVGVVGAKLLYPDGRLQHAGIVLDWHRPDIGYHRWYGGEDSPAASQRADVAAVTGACLMARRELFDMAPDLYPMGNYEDVHLCLNAWNNGYRVVYQPGAQLVHLEGMTKARTNIDYIKHNRDAFVSVWRAKFLDSPDMALARAANERFRGDS